MPLQSLLLWHIILYMRARGGYMKVCMLFWLQGLYIFRFSSRLELRSLLLPRVILWLLPRFILWLLPRVTPVVTSTGYLCGYFHGLLLWLLPRVTPVITSTGYTVVTSAAYTCGYCLRPFRLGKRQAWKASTTITAGVSLWLLGLENQGNPERVEHTSSVDATVRIKANTSHQKWPHFGLHCGYFHVLHLWLLPRVTPWLLPRVTPVLTTVKAFQAWKAASLKGFN